MRRQNQRFHFQFSQRHLYRAPSEDGNFLKKKKMDKLKRKAFENEVLKEIARVFVGLVYRYVVCTV